MIAPACLRTGDRVYFSYCYPLTTSLHYVSVLVLINSKGLDSWLSGSNVCLFVFFPWRYNPLWLYFHSPVAGFSLLVFEVS